MLAKNAETSISSSIDTPPREGVIDVDGTAQVAKSGRRDDALFLSNIYIESERKYI
jgi:hypothetical protein